MGFPTRGIFRGCWTPFLLLRCPPRFWGRFECLLVRLCCWLQHGPVSRSSAPLWSCLLRTLYVPLLLVSSYIRGISLICRPKCSGYTPGCFQGRVHRTGILYARYRLPGLVASASNESCLRQIVGLLLHLVYRETDRSCLYPFRGSGGFPIYEDFLLAASTVCTYKSAILSVLSPRQIFPRHSCFYCALSFIGEIRRFLLLFLRGTLGSFFARYLLLRSNL